MAFRWAPCLKGLRTSLEDHRQYHTFVFNTVLFLQTGTSAASDGDALIAVKTCPEVTAAFAQVVTTPLAIIVQVNIFLQINKYERLNLALSVCP